jgi:hypothetical protein
MLSNGDAAPNGKTEHGDEQTTNDLHGSFHGESFKDTTPGPSRATPD